MQAARIRGAAVTGDWVVAAVAPGDRIRAELKARGWTQRDLAEITGQRPDYLNRIIVGKVGISPAMATRLAAAFGTSAEFWLNLQNAYRLWRIGNRAAAGWGLTGLPISGILTLASKMGV